MSKHIPTLVLTALVTGGAHAAVVFDTNLPLVRDNVGPDSMIVGSGIPADHFAVDTNVNGASVALKARNRDTGQALSVTNGLYRVSPGLSAVVTPGSPQLAFDFQFSPGASGLAANLVWLELMVDFDPSAGTNFASFLAPIGGALDASDGYFTNGECRSGTSPIACTWSSSDPYAYSQAWNLGFGFWSGLLGGPTNYDPFAPGLYDISFTAYTGASPTALTRLASVSIQAQVGVVPEPASVALVGLALAGLAASRRKA